MLKKISLSFLLAICPILSASAADGVTIIMESGVIVKLKNGYSQLQAGLSANASSKKQIQEIKVEGETLHLNLDHVSVICRDDCRMAEVIWPKKQER